MLRALLVILMLSGTGFSAYAEDRRVNYYYPPVGTEELFDRSIGSAPPAIAAVRTAFLTQFTKEQLASPTKPRISIFAKGSDAQHMIIVALDDEVFRTLFRARAVLAQMTSHARTTPFFKKNGIQFNATWFDLAKILGFVDIVITDGDTWSHKIVIE